jgi:hypothetical protein
MKIKDLVSLPEIRTVVQLRDVHDPDESSRLVEHFVLTDEVRRGLQIILQAVVRGSGCGCFLKGHYGSGKSHFLSYLSLVLSHPVHRQAFLRRFKERPRADAASLEGLAGKNIAVVNLSLVEHRSAEHLEDIAGNAVHEFLHRSGAPRKPKSAEPDGRSSGETPDSSAMNRRKYFEALFAELRARGFHGMLLLIDELSEFLRSKPNLRDFNEDVRYLQFLGELSAAEPLWIVAALQEHIEETGQINQEVFNKIKDRYPIRLALTAQHVKALVKELIVRKKADAHGPINELYRTFRSSFPALAIPQEEFVDLYPVHPSSIELLELLKPLFSKTRGFVDFVHYQVRGDSSRGITGLLDEPMDRLLCPDRIFDHFLDRMQSTVEIVPFIETVFAHYVRELPRIIPETDDRTYAFRLIKLLILQDICPVRQEFPVRRLAEMLLERITDIDPQVNYAYTSDIAEQLLSKGGFLTRSLEPGQDPSEAVYHLELHADVGPVVSRKLEYRRESLRALGRQVEWRLFKHLVPRTPFFAEIGAATPQVLTVEWQNTRRAGIVSFAGSEAGDTQSLLGEEQPADFRLILLLPGLEPEEGLKAVTLSTSAYGILQPAAIGEAERCLSLLALFELLEEIREDESSQARRVRERIEAQIAEQIPVVTELYARRFEQSQLLSEYGELLYTFQPAARNRVQQLFQDAAGRLLEARFPKHYLIAPQLNFYPQGALEEVHRFFHSMSAEAFEQMRWGRTVLDGFLLPLGIVRRNRKEYSFAPDAGNCRPLQLLLERLETGEKLSGRQALQLLGDSEFGMSELQFKPFLMAALFAGFMVEYREGRKVPLQQLQPARLLEIQELAPGQTLAAEALLVLRSLELVPKRFHKSALSYPECQLCWEALKSEVTEIEQMRRQVEQLAGRYIQYRVFGQLKRGSLQKALEEVSALTGAVRVSYPPVEGLEAFAKEVAAPETTNQAIQHLKSWHRFLNEEFTAFVFIAAYLEGAQDSVSGRPELLAPVASLVEQWHGFDPGKDSDGFRSIKTEFDAWMQDYTAVYQQEHDRFYSSEAFDSLAGLLDSPGFKLLERLQRVKFFVPDRPSASIAEAVRKELERRCKRSVWEELQQRPMCGCGFRLGQPAGPPPVERFRSDIENQLTQFVRQVQHPRVQELLDRFEFQAGRLPQDSPPKSARAPGSAARILKRIESVGQLVEGSSQISDDLVERLNRFEPDRQPFQVRQLADFLRTVGSEPKPPSTLVRSFSDWLAEGLADPDQPVRLVLARQESQAEEGEALRSLVFEKTPGLQADFERLTREEFLFRVFSAELIGRYSVATEAAAERLPLAPAQPQIEAYRRLAAALPERIPMTEPVANFESRIAEEDLQALGVVGDAPAALARLVAGEGFFPQLSRLGLARLSKALAHTDEKVLGKVRRLLFEEWKAAVHPGFASEREQQRLFLESFIWVAEFPGRLKEVWRKTPGSGPDRGAADGPRRISKAVESFYCEKASLAHYMLDRLVVIGGQLGLGEITDLGQFRRKIEDPLEQFLQQYEAEITLAGDTLPRVESAVKSGLGRLKTGRDICGVRIIFVDALGWPLWNLLSSRLERSLPPGVLLLDSIPAYARQPSVTGEHVKRWIEAELIADKGAPLPGRLPLLQDRNEESTYHIDWIDTKVHGSRESVYFLYEEILDQFEAQSIATLRAFRKNTLVVLISDHGFRENPLYDRRDKYRNPRYLHGGKSPLEVVVPVVFFLV